IVALAQVMDLQVVAEGVETVEQLQILRDLGVHRGQGYLFGTPASGDSIYKQLFEANPRRNSVTDTIPFVPARFN
ncbi:MAG: EAL domain-containing protein, partial [Pirellulaceae bacterium]|nr:EAL domain-containing protein [Pirellulaceae bacterium]